MEKLDIQGATPLREDQFKVILNDVFTPQEIGALISSTATTLKNFLSFKEKLNLKSQIDNCGSAMGKLLLAMPEEIRFRTIKMLREQVGLTFQVSEVQQQTGNGESQGEGNDRISENS